MEGKRNVPLWQHPFLQICIFIPNVHPFPSLQMTKWCYLRLPLALRARSLDPFATPSLNLHEPTSTTRASTKIPLGFPDHIFWDCLGCLGPGQKDGYAGKVSKAKVSHQSHQSHLKKSIISKSLEKYSIQKWFHDMMIPWKVIPCQMIESDYERFIIAHWFNKTPRFCKDKRRSPEFPRHSVKQRSRHHLPPRIGAFSERCIANWS